MTSATTIISAGLAIREVLASDQNLNLALRGQIYPVMADEATAPYICYNMTGVEQGNAKGYDGPATGIFEMAVYAKTYLEACVIAERVRELLHNYSGTAAGLVVRSSAITNCVDGYDADAYVKVLTLTLKV